MIVKRKLENFISRYCRGSAPVLLALSGGADSLALLYALMECGCPFHIVHVDHGWREESKEEANILRHLAQSRGIPFHLKTLDPSNFKGNLEMACRIERYRFFAELCSEHQLCGVFVAHHQDDQAETVLKRVLEGSNWSNLSGLKPVTLIDGLKIYRPFLEISKGELLKYLQSKGAVPFEDSSNENTLFLRARMRQIIFPWLNQSFGKEVRPGLVRLAAEMDEMRLYFDELLAPFLNKIVIGPLGNYLDLNEGLPKSAIEAKYLIRKFCEMSGITLSRNQIEFTADALMSGKANKIIENGSGKLIVDRRILFVIDKKIVSEWSFEASEGYYQDGLINDWKSVWTGYCEAWLPLGEFELCRWNDLESSTNKKSIDKRWTNESIPAFLRSLVPLVCREGVIIHEFLSGKNLNSFKEGQKALKIKAITQLNPNVTV